MIELEEYGINNIEEIKVFFKNVFMSKPWNDDWSNENQLHQYIIDLIGNRNSLTLVLIENNKLVGLAMGNIMHWHSGTEYYIYEFCIKTEEQGRGLGTLLLKNIEEYVVQKGINHIFLQTERSVPAYEFYKKNGFYELENHISFVKKLK